jgi:hypothetical protein
MHITNMAAKSNGKRLLGGPREADGRIILE